MSRIFKRVTVLYGLTAKNVAAQILGNASATSSEAMPSQRLGVVPLQEVKMGETTTTSALEQPPIRPTSPKGRILGGQTQRKEPSPPATVNSEGEEKSTESTALVKRNRAPAQTQKATGGDAEIINFTVGREHEVPADDATNKVAEAVTEKEGELEFPPPLSDD
ncbi:hypothetical protein Dimus_007981, partial [Dionaea muscipula]